MHMRAVQNNELIHNSYDYEYLPVAAAASEPSSLTSIKALCTTSDTYNGSFVSNRPLKSARRLNISDIPN